jgi:hypothetical protein
MGQEKSPNHCHVPQMKPKDTDPDQPDACFSCNDDCLVPALRRCTLALSMTETVQKVETR